MTTGPVVNGNRSGAADDAAALHDILRRLRADDLRISRCVALVDHEVGDLPGLDRSYPVGDPQQRGVYPGGRFDGVPESDLLGHQVDLASAAALLGPDQVCAGTERHAELEQ